MDGDASMSATPVFHHFRETLGAVFMAVKSGVCLDCL